MRDRKKAVELLGRSGGNLTLISSFDELDPLHSYFHAVINLAGDPIGEGRWTASKKERIYQSRLGLTHNLISFLSKLKTPPKTLISGSAIGYYGVNSEHTDTLFDEETSPLSLGGLSHDLCAKWEESALTAEKLGIRFVYICVFN